MVWGMRLGSGFGDFFPAGDFGNWDEQLGEFFKKGMTEERKQALLRAKRTYTGWISEAFKQEIGPRPDSSKMVVNPLNEELPTEYKTVKSHKTLGSIIMLPDQLIAVNQDIKNLLEELEPGIHRFWPIRIVMPKNQEYPCNYFGILVGTFLDSFVPDKSDPASFDQGMFYYPRDDSKKTFAGLVFDEKIIGKSHLWRERRLKIPDLLLSDTLQSRIVAAKLRVPKMLQGALA